MGGLPFEIWLFLRRLWWLPKNFYEYWRLPRFKVGDIYLDCGWHPVFCTAVERMPFHWLGPWDKDISGISLLDGSSPRGCSLIHCAPVKIPYKAAEHIVSLMLDCGNSRDLSAALAQRGRGVENIQNIYNVSPELKRLWR
jgi:hypothetical protein